MTIPEHIKSFAALLKRRERRPVTRPNLTPAAVLLPLVHTNKGLSVLFTQRSHGVEHHKGEISFPGGRVDQTDADTMCAALRETHEELGVDPCHVKILGPLDDFISISGYKVTPYAGYISPLAPPYSPQPSEVADVFCIPLDELLNSVPHKMTISPTGEEIHYFCWGDKVVWGLTGAILYHFLNLTHGYEGSKV